MTRLAELLSFRRIVDSPFDACMAALDSWQLTGHGSELRLGHSVLWGPVERDSHLGTCRIEVSLARGRLRRPVRMRLDIEPWPPTATALELIPCRRVRPRRAYFEAGHDLLDRLTQALPARCHAAQGRLADRVSDIGVLTAISPV